MRVILVNPPRCGDERTEIAPPLGLLSLASVAQAAGVAVAIEDFNLLQHLLPNLRHNFYENACQRLLALEGDVYAFTSMAVDSHIAIELARLVKESRPEIMTVLGGPHFSMIGDELVRRYPWLDLVISGEGERPLARFLAEKLHSSVRSDGAEELAPARAYSLVHLDAYFAVNPTHTANFETGRGCRYKCAFCYSPSFYGTMRNYGTEGLVDQLAEHVNLGFRRVFVVNDNLLNNVAWANQFCESLAEARLGISWSCYATLPDLSDATSAALGRAGCSQVFMGIDVAGRAAERALHKRFLRTTQDLTHKLRSLVDAGVQPTCGFILSPPSHPAGADTDAILEVALEARRAGADVVINALSLYPGTPVHADVVSEPDALQTRLLMDVPGIAEMNPFASALPHAFPFHSRYVGESEWREFLFLCHAAHTVVNTFPRALQRACVLRGCGPSQIVREVLAQLPDLMSLPPAERRAAEQDAALIVLPSAAEEELCDYQGNQDRGPLGQLSW